MRESVVGVDVATAELVVACRPAGPAGTASNDAGHRGHGRSASVAGSAPHRPGGDGGTSGRWWRRWRRRACRSWSRTHGHLNRKPIAALSGSHRWRAIVGRCGASGPSGVAGRLVTAGKSKKVALIACMRKLLTILNAMMRTSTTWQQGAEVPALTFKIVAIVSPSGRTSPRRSPTRCSSG